MARASGRRPRSSNRRHLSPLGEVRSWTESPTVIEGEDDAADRSRRFSFVKMCPMWDFTVTSLTKGSSAISLLLARTMRRITSARGVGGPAPPSGAFMGPTARRPT
jgi:hypothetical protein